uniref:Uncharacterized protein n=1 Tax=Anguilla anguilla TaxID=7936 RepID=A0A0E9Q7H1_ANGAN
MYPWSDPLCGLFSWIHSRRPSTSKTDSSSTRAGTGPAMGHRDSWRARRRCRDSWEGGPREAWS